MRLSKRIILSLLIIGGLLLSHFPLPPATSLASIAPAQTSPDNWAAVPDSLSSASNEPAPASGSPNSTQNAGGQSAGQQVVVTLRPANETILQKFLQELQDPASSNYRRFLSETEFRQQFAPPPQAADSFKQYFSRYNLSLSYESQDGLVLAFKGSRADLDKAFNTTSEYRSNSAGQAGFINIKPLYLPANLLPLVSGVAGFDNLNTARLFSRRQSAPNLLAGPMTPTDLRAAYNLPASLSGSGRRVGITLWGAPDTTDLARWSAYYGKPLDLTLIPATATATTNEGLRFEANMDVQLVHTAAYDAAIRFYVANSSSLSDLLVSLSQAVNDSVDAVSSSWGACEPAVPGAAIAGYHTVFQAAAARGTSMIFASGDSGVYECNQLDQLDYVGFSAFPASDDLVTAAGGTRLQANGSLWDETGWSCPTTFDVECSLRNSYGSPGSSGGGVAIQQARPFYQNFSPPAEAKFPIINGLLPTRLLPDISLNADPESGLLVFFITNDLTIPSPYRCNDSCTGGGTSAAAPLLAGIVALTAQSVKQSRPVEPFHPLVGQLNPFLYRNQSAFGTIRNGSTWGYDVKTGYNGVYAGSGWDYVTGLGSLVDANLFIASFTAGVLGVSGVWLDDNGNPNLDRVAQPGETIKFQIDLTNFSAAIPASNIRAVVQLMSGAATPVITTVIYPSVAPGQLVSNQTPFTFGVSPNASCGERLRFRLLLLYNTSVSEDQSYSYDFSVSVGNPATTYSYLPPNPVIIPDGQMSGLTVPFTVSTPISDFKLQVSIEHPDVRQLELKLLPPTGSPIPLTLKQGNGPNFSLTVFDDLGSAPVSATQAPHADAVRPQVSFEASLSISPTTPLPTGVWKLEIIDTATGGVGKLRNAAFLGLNCICPAVSSASPSYVIAGGADFTLIVNGQHFNGVSEVNWSGSYRPTTLVQTGEKTLQVTISANDIAQSRPVTITIFNRNAPGPNSSGCRSNELVFLVVTPLPLITALSEVAKVSPGASYALTVYGKNFTSTSVVHWASYAATTTFISSSKLSAIIPSALVTATQLVPIRVYNSVAGRLSNTVPFQLGCDPLLVSSPLNVDSCGTLPTALFFTRWGNQKNIRLTFTNPATLNVGKGLIIPPAVSITPINNKCENFLLIDGSGVRGDGLILSGNNYLQALRVKGFIGRQVVNLPGGFGNQLSCFAATRN